MPCSRRFRAKEWGPARKSESTKRFARWRQSKLKPSTKWQWFKHQSQDWTRARSCKWAEPRCLLWKDRKCRSRGWPPKRSTRANRGLTRSRRMLARSGFRRCKVTPFTLRCLALTLSTLTMEIEEDLMECRIMKVCWTLIQPQRTSWTTGIIWQSTISRSTTRWPLQELKSSSIRMCNSMGWTEWTPSKTWSNQLRGQGQCLDRLTWPLPSRTTSRVEIGWFPRCQTSVKVSLTRERHRGSGAREIDRTPSRDIKISSTDEHYLWYQLTNTNLF